MITSMFIALIATSFNVELGPEHNGIWTISKGKESIGQIRVTGDEPPSGHAPNAEYWDWDGMAWPSVDFRIKPDQNASPDPLASDVYDSADFPVPATHELPQSIGLGDKMYALSVCDPSACHAAGFLWVVTGGSTLHWYLRSEWQSSRLRAEPGEWIRFQYLQAVPSTTQDHRYLSHVRK